MAERTSRRVVLSDLPSKWNNWLTFVITILTIITAAVMGYASILNNMQDMKQRSELRDAQMKAVNDHLRTLDSTCNRNDRNTARIGTKLGLEMEWPKD